MKHDAVPDFCEYRVGWRAWKPMEPHYLCAMNGNFIWTPKRIVQADKEPTMTNTHGVWAFTTLFDLRRMGYDTSGNILGRVAFWGTVVHHETGLRAEFAYPLELYVDRSENKRLGYRSSSHDELWERALRIGAEYNVPVKLLVPSEEETIALQKLEAARIEEERLRMLAMVEHRKQAQKDREAKRRAIARAALDFAKKHGFKM